MSASWNIRKVEFLQSQYNNNFSNANAKQFKSKRAANVPLPDSNGSSQKVYFCFAQITGKALWAISCPIQSVGDGIEIVRLVTFTEIISNGRIKGCRFGKSADDKNTIILLMDTSWYCSVL